MIFIILLALLIPTSSLAEIPQDVCDRINSQSTDCQKRLNEPTIDQMRAELELLRIKHELELARDGKFEQPQPIIIINKQQPEDVKITATFEEK
jgi:hypothetical protein